MSDGIIALVPVKGLADAKSRLADRLDASERAALVERLLDGVLAALNESGVVQEAIVVSPEDSIRRRAIRAGATAITEPAGEDGSPAIRHNRALERARQVALERYPAAVLVLSSDLPLIRAEDVRDLARLGTSTGTVVLGPDRDTVGTNAMLLRPADALEFRFGADSFEAHRSQAEASNLQVEVYPGEGIAFDLDRPEDLDRLAERDPSWIGVGSGVTIR